MINLQNAKSYCRDDICHIENYERAIADAKKWVCHHRLEIQGNIITSKKELIEKGLYYKRPASELIFMDITEHHNLHYANLTKETRDKISNANRGYKHTEEAKEKISKSKKGKKCLGENNNATIVICLETNEIYSSIIELARDLSLEPRVLYNKFRNHNKFNGKTYIRGGKHNDI